MNSKFSALCPIIIGTLLLCHTLMPPYVKASDDDALALYHQAISAKTIGERQAFLEKALKIYIRQFNTLNKAGQMNGMLCYNIGNCYFNLGQLGEAIYYYRTGLKLLPGNPALMGNLKTALAKRKHPSDMESGGIKEILLFFHYKISTKNRITILIGASFLAAILLIGLMFWPNTVLKYIAGLSMLVVFALFTSIGVEYYWPRHEGVILKTTDVRKGPGSGFAPVTAKPFGEGSSIEVLSLKEEWYKVKLNDGRQGYIDRDHLRIIL